MNTQHTPTPWKAIMVSDVSKRSHSIYGTDKEKWICNGLAQTDAEFIVRACNAHEELLAACKALTVFFGTYNGEGSRAVLAQAQAAIAKAQ